jgi:recombination protein RecA
MNDRLSSFLASESLKKLAKHLKRDDIIMRASDHRAARIARIPTTIFPLDRALGGGFPVGVVNLMFGFKASSKTTTLLKTIANAQKMCANCWKGIHPITGELLCTCPEYREPIVAMVNVEGTWDASWASSLGVDTTKILYSEPEYGEQAVDIFEAILLSGECDIIYLDSLAFLVPIKETEESAERDFMGQQPRLIGKLIRKTTAALNTLGNDRGRRPTVFFTNQIRNKMTMFGNPEVQPGGLAIGFSTSTEVRVKSNNPELDEATKLPKYCEIEFKIEKNKYGGTRGMEGSYRLVLMDTETKKKGSVIDEPAVVEVAEQQGVLFKSKNKWICLGEEFSARSHVERRLMIDPEFSYIVKQHLLNLDFKASSPDSVESAETAPVEGTRSKKKS